MTPLYAKPATRRLRPERHSPAAEPVFLHDFFDRAVRRGADQIAIEVPPGSTHPIRREVSYGQFKDQADALASFLSDVVKEECVVAILLPRTSEHVYLSQLAVLKAGAAYACIDPAFPDEQLRNILEDARPVAILTDRLGFARVRRVRPETNGVLDVVDWLDQPHEPGTPLESASWLTPNSLAYIIYTSGTTGRPKGVMIEHGSIVNLVQGDLRTCCISPEDRVGQSSSSAYDSSVEEIWMALAAGATLVVMDDETTRLGPDLVPWLRRERITVLSPSPTLLRATGCSDPQRALPDLRLVHVGGEALPEDVVERWAPGRSLVNDYGPTECSVTALRARIEVGGAITIGQPLPGIQAWVLNDLLEEVADGEQGELCLGGIALARGYLNEPEMTARKFPHHPRLGRIYRTGDLVHRDADGNYFCHGRIDAQVKIRGYRIELEAIEARLIECAGVREAACRTQGEGGQKRIVAFVVPENPAAPPTIDALKYAIRQTLPEYMVPGGFGILSKLPTTVSGKLNRRELPVLDGHGPEGNRIIPPRNAVEEKLAIAFRKILNLHDEISVHHDFFNDLGGNSLLGASLISLLRDDETTASLTVRNLYEARTVAELAKRVSQPNEKPAEETIRHVNQPKGQPILATLIQALWLVGGLLLGAPVAYVLACQALPALLQGLGLIPLLLVSPLLYFAGVLVYGGVTVSLAVLAKKILIGQYRPLRASVWGSFYVRNWIVQHTVRLVPWRLLEGTVFQQMILRALGARIGQRVHIHRGVNLLQGGWDLLDIGDEVTLSQDAAVRLVTLEAGEIVVGPITLEKGSTLDIRAGVAGNTHLEANTYLTALSFLPAGSRIPQGEKWDGIPAKPVGQAPTRPATREEERDLSPVQSGLLLLLARLTLGAFVALPLEALGLVFALVLGVDTDDAAEWLTHPTLNVAGILLSVGLATLAVPLTLLFQVLAMRGMGRVSPGVISRWSLGHIRVRLKTDIIESASLWLSGTLLWPVWLRWAGMKIGRGTEIGSIMDTIPELVEIGPATFFADGVYLGGPRVHRGTVTLAPVRLGTNTFLGNHVVILAGQHLPDDVLIGVCTVADDATVRPGTSWFGHPPFELPRREVVECDRRLTHEPTLIRYINRVFWELLRFTLPLGPMLLGLSWLNLLMLAQTRVSLPVLLFGVIPLLDVGVVAILCLVVLILKWALLGRVRPGQHPLWSCWCSRWDFHYVVWDIFARGPLGALEGTLLLNVYLRAMGMRIGHGVALGDGFAHVVDPDMLEFEDGATVSGLFQAHTFEDRVLKIDHVIIRSQATVGNSAVLLYGADIGARTQVGPHSVVMKRERLLPDRCYTGAPTRVVGGAPHLARQNSI